MRKGPSRIIKVRKIVEIGWGDWEIGRVERGKLFFVWVVTPTCVHHRSSPRRYRFVPDFFCGYNKKPIAITAGMMNSYSVKYNHSLEVVHIPDLLNNSSFFDNYQGTRL